MNVQRRGIRTTDRQVQNADKFIFEYNFMEGIILYRDLGTNRGHLKQKKQKRDGRKAFFHCPRFLNKGRVTALSIVQRWLKYGIRCRWQGKNLAKNYGTLSF